jgi:hypothetical protein
VPLWLFCPAPTIRQWQGQIGGSNLVLSSSKIAKPAMLYILVASRSSRGLYEQVA